MPMINMTIFSIKIIFVNITFYDLNQIMLQSTIFVVNWNKDWNLSILFKIPMPKKPLQQIRVIFLEDHLKLSNSLRSEIPGHFW